MTYKTTNNVIKMASIMTLFTVVLFKPAMTK